MSGRRLRSRLCVVVLIPVVGFIVLFSFAPALSALDHERAVRLLGQAGDFRVRVNAALVIGRSKEPALAPHLERTLLNDSHPAVRAAAAAALAALGSRDSLPALLRARKDPSPAVRSQAARSVDILSRKQQTPSSPALRRSGGQGNGEVESERSAPRSLEGVGHLVTLGNMNDRSGADDGRFAEMLRSELARLLEGMSGVAVLSDPSAVDRALEKEIRRRGICRLRIDGTVVEVKRDIYKGEVSSSCAVSLMVLEDPGMIIRAVLSGSATSKGLRSKTAERQKQALFDQALRSAVRSALSNFDSVMARSDGGAKRAGAKRNSGAVLKSSVALANPSKS